MERKKDSIRTAYPIESSKILRKMKDVLLLLATHSTNAEHHKLTRQGFNQVYSSSYKTGHRRGGGRYISNRVIFEKISICG